MQRKVHLIGDVDLSKVNQIIDMLKEKEENIDCEYIESLRDLKIDSNNDHIIEILNGVIDSLSFNIKVVERKRGRKPSNQAIEKRIFMFTDFISNENAMFLVSYLLNNPQIKEAKFDYRQQILTVKTTDAFIFNKISRVVEVFDENIEITESYAKAKKLDMYLMLKFMMLAILVFSVSLILVTLYDPTIVSVIAWIVTYLIIAFRNAKEVFDNFKDHHYLETTNVILFSSMLMFLIGYFYEATIILFIYQSLERWLKQRCFKLVTRLVKQIDKTVKLIRVKDGDVYVQKQVDDIKENDVILLNQGSMCLFDGVVLDGTITVNTCLLDGNKDNKECKQEDFVASGTKIVQGGADLKVTKPYHKTKISKLYQYSLIDMNEIGELEQKETRIHRILLCIAVMLSLVMLLVSIFSNHISLLGPALLIILSSFTVSMIRRFIYQFAIIKALKNDIFIKNEKSLGKIIQDVRCYFRLPKEKQKSYEHQFQYHLGGIENINKMKQYDCIYDDELVLEKVLLFIYQLDRKWRLEKLLSFSLKLILFILLAFKLINFTIFIIFAFSIDCMLYLHMVKTMEKKVN